MNNILHVGLDIGSTTIKIVVLDESKKILYSSYTRHFSDTKNTLFEVLSKLAKDYPNQTFTMSLTGSGALDIAKILKIPFIQEVIACKTAVENLIPQTDVVIELGGEDAKIIYFDKFIEQRMNGTCAGGTGAFLDQMASLLNTDTAGLNELAKSYETIYPIASRCGVFAKTDIQPLLNEGARKEDIAASIFQAVVNQTISGLACGRPIRGNVAFLGGPLNYLSELRQRFIETLNLKGNQIIVPENAHLLVATGAAINSMETKSFTNKDLQNKLKNFKNSKFTESKPLPALFETEEDYKKFKERHDKDKVKRNTLENYSGDCYIGIDAGSTTTKLVLIDSNGALLYSLYGSNGGNPLKSVVSMLKKLYKVLPKTAKLRYSGVTGYGEKLIQTGLNVDLNEIETIAHYTAAKEFMPNVTSIIDIGGQDMKYIKLKDNAIDNIMLNEACSSGCGSFLETFAKSLNLPIEDFVKAAIESRTPVDLGSRCTVFMNSKIKQAQKEGFSVGDISSGLSYSIIKNAIQKVMKVRDTKTLGNHIVVQGGTFYNDAVLRAFELIVGKEVIRPDIAGLMGAYGAALYAKAHSGTARLSKLLSASELKNFTHTVKAITCGGCSNHCKLTVNTFSDGSSYIAGNRCEKPIKSGNNKKSYDLCAFKNEMLKKYRGNSIDRDKVTVGIPMGLNIYELLPFWHTLFKELGFNVIVSPESNHKLYRSGQHTIPSDTACYPAKLMHGHIESLIQQNVDIIFYPCMTYNFDEKLGDNHYNCPVVAYYPKVIGANVKSLEKLKFIDGFIGIHDRKEFPAHFVKMMKKYGCNLNLHSVKIAAEKLKNRQFLVWGMA